MSDILKDIFNSFAEASRIGQRIQMEADKAMQEEQAARDEVLSIHHQGETDEEYGIACSKAAEKMRAEKEKDE